MRDKKSSTQIQPLRQGDLLFLGDLECPVCASDDQDSLDCMGDLDERDALIIIRLGRGFHFCATRLGVGYVSVGRMSRFGK